MIEDNKENRKSRDLTLPELFDILQKEYIVFELRAKIYPQNHHRDFWLELASKKKEKIISIAHRHKFISIFDIGDIKKEYYDLIVPKVGFPNFIYSGDLQKLKQEKWDIHNYYMPGSEVSVYLAGEIEEEFLYGKIEKVILPENTAYILVNGEVNTYDLSLVTRVL